MNLLIQFLKLRKCDSQLTVISDDEIDDDDCIKYILSEQPPNLS